MRTAAVISYSSYQKHYIEKLIAEAKKFVSGEIVVVSFDHFFDGQEEEPMYVSGETDLRIHFIPGHESRYYHNLQRRLGYAALQETYDAVFFFDADEVPIGDRMAEWLQTADIANYRFASYWYYRDTCYQSDTYIDSLALVSNESLKTAKWFANDERESFADYDSWRRLTTYQDLPLVHHYSWSGTKEMLLRKVQSWGHNKDEGTDWVGMLEYEFSHPFEFKCPFKPYEKYKLVDPDIGFTFNKDDEMKPLIGIMVPTRSRPERLRQLYESLLVNTEGMSELVVGIDADEMELYAWVKDHPDIKVIETPQVDYVAKANFMAERMKDYDYLYLLADDFVINSKFEKYFMEKAKKNCIFYGRDEMHNSKLPTAVLIDNNIAKALGYIAPPTLVHYFADNIWQEWGRALGTYEYFDHIKVQHLHPVKYQKYNDAVYQNSAKHFGEDREAYEIYMGKQFFKDVEKLQQ